MTSARPSPAGATTFGALKERTKAASTCGGCAPLVTQVLKAELQAAASPSTIIFASTSPTIGRSYIHLVRIDKHRDVRRTHAPSTGAASAAISASRRRHRSWPRAGTSTCSRRQELHVAGHQRLFLANIQRDGTYSIIPRVAGGEITPEQLITIGQIASKYRLYTKITGGQRIDMLGARVEQLPHIWRELCDAGFESGHAYGKALRTVKSCVGSTWCRYGVQDIVGLAISIENRYKGLRSPHKIKFGGVRLRTRVRRGAGQGLSASSRPRRARISTYAAMAA